MVRIIVRIHCVCYMPGLQCCSVSICCLVQNFACTKVDYTVLSPGMFCYVRTGFTLFDVSFMFLFSRSEGSVGFTADWQSKARSNKNFTIRERFKTLL